MSKKFYAQKDTLGFPIPGTMMSGSVVPKAKNIIEISLYNDVTHFDKPHPKGLRYFVTVDKQGKIVPNSLVAALHNPGKNRVEIGSLSNGIPSNCIQFTVDTTGSTWFGFNTRSNTEDFTYTITWGDGTTNEGSTGEGYVELIHEYPETNKVYTARLCYSNAAVVHEIDFYGFD